MAGGDRRAPLVRGTGGLGLEVADALVRLREPREEGR